MMQRVPGVAPNPVQVSLALERHEVFVLHRKGVGPHKTRSAAPDIITNISYSMDSQKEAFKENPKQEETDLSLKLMFQI